MSSKVFLSREPWKRSMRTRSATSSSRQATSPPSPSANRFLVGKKLNVEQTPVWATPSAPNACAASSISGSPSAASSPSDAGRPKRCTGTIAFVRVLIRVATSSGSRLRDTGSMSANTGVAPTRAIASAVAKNVNAGQTTSSSRPIPSASSARTIASVPFATPTACGTPRNAAASLSNASTSGPKMRRPDSRTAENRCSSSGMNGAYCAFTSMSGICSVTRASVAPARPAPGSSDAWRVLGEPAPASLHVSPGEPRRTPDDRGSDQVLHVAECVMDAFSQLSPAA